MPIGIFIDSSSVLLGGIAGALLGKKLPENLKTTLPMIFAISAAALGISLICNVVNLSAVILALILGTTIGELLNVDGSIRKLVSALEKKTISSSRDNSSDGVFMTLVMLFCFSATGSFGAMVEGFSGEYDVLLTKSVLDFFTAAIFASNLGYKVSLIAIPQLAIYAILFSLANLIIPIINTEMIADFRACGGIINLAVGLNLLKLKDFKLLNVVPSLIIVMFVSAMWMNIFA